MSCCNACFEYSVRWIVSPETSKREDRPPQGHFLCGVPTEQEKGWFIAGSRPNLVNNRWSIGPSNNQHRGRTPATPPPHS